MTAEYGGIVRQSAQAQQARPGGLSATFKEPSAAQREERIADRNQLEFWPVEGQVSLGVPSHIQNLELTAP